MHSVKRAPGHCPPCLHAESVPAAEQPWCPRSPALILQLAGGAMTTLMCILVTATTWHSMAGRSERLAMLAQCAVKLGVMAFVLRRPAAFWENR